MEAGDPFRGCEAAEDIVKHTRDMRNAYRFLVWKYE
jgi:hypothetical protein